MMTLPKYPQKQTGFAAIEMTLVTPVFILLIAGAVELTQIIQADHIIISISREGGNIVSRSSTETPQKIMDTIAITAGPLDLSSDGAIYITSVTGKQNELPYVSSQYKWNQAGFNKSSDIWSNCGDWEVDGACDISQANPPTLNNFSLNLDDGESVYVVEVFYDYTPLFNLVLDANFTLSDVTYM
ncbi:TadE/TadG family type IV pilus assembly protein [Vibrio cortegadensis]|uniref:TadE/TadG family type IV pilus assembly protein n=1 Tax=Vibrio cortegadensis TaxID=1328770 RepID=UPI00352DD7D1